MKKWVFRDYENKAAKAFHSVNAFPVRMINGIPQIVFQEWVQVDATTGLTKEETEDAKRGTGYPAAGL